MEYSVYQMIQENYACVLIISFLLFFLVRNNSFSPRIRKYFIEGVICVLLVVIIDAWELFEAMKPEPTLTRLLLCIAGYMVRPVIAFLVDLAAWGTTSRWRKTVFSIPLMINTLSLLTALFCPLSFYLTEDNQFMRGPLNFIPFAVSIFYMIAVVVISIRIIGKGRAWEANIVVAISIISMGAAFLEAIYGFHVILTSSCVVGIAFYYIYLLIAQNDRDKLTGALLRRRFFLDSQKSERRVSAIISMDLNDLKKWNDEYGHIEGDKALKTVVDICMKHRRMHWDVYRLGGDEFVMLCYKATEADVKKFITDVQADLAETRYSAAMGYVMYQKDKSFQENCSISDERMYENKKAMKADIR